MTIPFTPYWHRRNLPHFEGGSIPQGVTFRLHDSLPQEKIAEMTGHILLPDKVAANRERIRIFNQLLDKGDGAVWLKNSAVAEIVQNSLLFFDGQRYSLHAWVIMPNHVHVLFTPMDDWTLTKIIHSWKSFSAREANKILGRVGEFWQREYFDRAIRNEQGFNSAVAYIENNPVKAGLCQVAEEWLFGSAVCRIQASCTIRSLGILPEFQADSSFE
ncbi:MAG: transposase [Deltaproteobacteria bacterium]|jgi:putative DNA methylase|nr:transposase [Deltaproteobacteria bacterium]